MNIYNFNDHLQYNTPKHKSQVLIQKNWKKFLYYYTLQINLKTPPNIVNIRGGFQKEQKEITKQTD